MRRAAWQGSTRSKRLPKDWNTRRQRILHRDRGICYVCGKPGADEVDHLNRGDDHRESNLAAIHSSPCHAKKTAREGNEARATKYARKRQAEPHPGWGVTPKGPEAPNRGQ